MLRSRQSDPPYPFLRANPRNPSSRRGASLPPELATGRVWTSIRGLGRCPAGSIGSRPAASTAGRSVVLTWGVFGVALLGVRGLVSAEEGNAYIAVAGAIASAVAPLAAAFVTGRYINSRAEVKSNGK